MLMANCRKLKLYFVCPVWTAKISDVREPTPCVCSALEPWTDTGKDLWHCRDLSFFDKEWENRVYFGALFRHIFQGEASVAVGDKIVPKQWKTQDSPNRAASRG